jgi:hypothetical protein
MSSCGSDNVVILTSHHLRANSACGGVASRSTNGASMRAWHSLLPSELAEFILSEQK